MSRTHHLPGSSDTAGEPWEVVTQQGNVVLGESPVWSVAQQALYWLDIDGRRLHRSQGSSLQSVQLTEVPSALGLVERHDACIWFATNRGVYLFSWSTLRSVRLASFPDSPAHRFNDGKVDPHGALLIGSMIAESNAAKRRGAGSVWRLVAQQNKLNALTATRVASGLSMPNGLDWASPGSPDMPSMLYLIDTPTKRIDRYTYAPISAPHFTLPQPQTLCSTDSLRDDGGELILGEPDGMARDVEGCLWVVMAGGGHVCRFSPDGRLLRLLKLPVSRITSLCFGGPEMRDLYVTSATKGVDRSKEPLAGSLFVLRDVGVAGREMNKLRGHFSIEEATDVQQYQLISTLQHPPTGVLRAKL